MDLKIPLVNLRRQHEVLAQSITSAIDNVGQNCDFILGRELEVFENEFARYCQAKYCVGVASGTDALILILRTLNLGPGDEIITSPLTFFATVEAILHVGAKPVFADVNPATLTIDPHAVEATSTSRTRAILPVSLYGNPPELAALEELADRRGWAIILDACQAHGARYRGNRIGSTGTATAFSFYPSKNLGAWGDGGAVVTNDPEIAAHVRRLRHHGQAQKNLHVQVGVNSRLDGIQAAILRAKLPHLDGWNERRRAHASHYAKLLNGSDFLKLVGTTPGAEPVFHLFVVRVGKRDEVHAYLSERGIGTGVHYPLALHLQPALSALGYEKGEFPAAEDAAAQVLSLPMFPELLAEEIEFVAAQLVDYVNSGCRA